MLPQFAVLGCELIHALLLFEDLLCDMIEVALVHRFIFPFSFLKQSRMPLMGTGEQALKQFSHRNERVHLFDR